MKSRWRLFISKSKQASNSIFLITDYWIKGPKAFITCIVALICSFLYGFYLVPPFLEVLYIKPSDVQSISNTLLSAYICTLSAVVAISALIMAILQLMNKRISISEFIFKNTYFILFTYWGLICILILVSFQIAFQQKDPIQNLEFIYARCINIMVYTFIILVLLACVVFAKIFRYLNFTRIIEDYIKTFPKVIHEETDNNPRAANKLSKMGREVFEEISGAIHRNGDTNLLHLYLESIETVFRQKHTSRFLQNLEWHIADWHILAITTPGNIDTLEQYEVLVASWRNLRSSAISSPNEDVRSKLCGIPAEVLGKLYALNFTPISIVKIAHYYSLHLKEMAVYPIWLSTEYSKKVSQYQLQDWILKEFILLIEEITKHNDLKALKTVLVQLYQIPERLELDQELEEETFASEGARSREVQKEYLNEEVKKLRIKIQNTLFALACKYIYSFYYAGDYTNYNHSIFNTLFPELFKLANPIPFGILDSSNYEILQWRNYAVGLEEHEDGESFSYPPTGDILTFGFISMLINMGNKIPDISSNKDFNDIFQLANPILQTLNKNSSLHHHIQHGKDETEFKTTINQLIAYLLEMQKRQKSKTSQELGKSKFSEEKVNSFKEKLVKQWKEGRNLYEVFNYYQAVEENPSEPLFQVGTPRMNLKGGKTMFVDGPLHQEVSGINWGSMVNSYIEKLFTTELLKVNNLNIEQQETIIEALDQVLRKTNKGNLVAFVGRRSFYNWAVLLNNSGNYQTNNGENEIYPFRYEGIYKEKVPIIVIDEPEFSNKVVVLELPNSMRYLQRTQPEFQENQLQLEINEVPDSDIDLIISRDPDLSSLPNNEEAKAIVKSNCYVLVQEIMKFKIIDVKGIKVFAIRKQ